MAEYLVLSTRMSVLQIIACLWHAPPGPAPADDDDLVLPENFG